MPKILSDTHELHQVGETAPPMSGAVPHAGRSSLERLLAVLCQLTPTASLSDVIAKLLRDFSEILPGYALAVRIPGDEGTGEILLSVPPIEALPTDLWAEEAVLFPTYAHERRFPLASRPEPACFHCASNDSSLDTDSSLVHTLLQCVGVLDTAIRFVDAHHAVDHRDQRIAQLEHTLLQNDKLASLGEISAGLVHDLTNPLTSIVAYTDYLQQKCERRGDDPEDIERLRRVGEAADLILSFTRAIVSYAKPDDDIPCPVDVSQVLEQALLFCKHVVDDSRVSVQVEIDSALPHVKAVRGQLTQVVVNLVTNACQAMAPLGGTLTISAHADPVENVVVIRAQDTGPGIDPEIVERVFDPFFTTKAEGVGTGLGLNIVRQVVERCGGSVRAESPKGEGALFIVTLPMHVSG